MTYHHKHQFQLLLCLCNIKDEGNENVPFIYETAMTNESVGEYAGEQAVLCHTDRCGYKGEFQELRES